MDGGEKNKTRLRESAHLAKQSRQRKPSEPPSHKINAIPQQKISRKQDSLLGRILFQVLARLALIGLSQNKAESDLFTFQNRAPVAFVSQTSTRAHHAAHTDTHTQTHKTFHQSHLLDKKQNDGFIDRCAPASPLSRARAPPDALLPRFCQKRQNNFFAKNLFFSYFFGPKKNFCQKKSIRQLTHKDPSPLLSSPPQHNTNKQRVHSRRRPLPRASKGSGVIVAPRRPRRPVVA